jgi:hypothetical protein
LKLLLDALHAAPTPEDARLILKSRAATQMPLNLTLDASETNNFNTINFITSEYFHPVERPCRIVCTAIQQERFDDAPTNEQTQRIRRVKIELEELSQHAKCLFTQSTSPSHSEQT